MKKHSEISRVISYIPYGEIFVEQQSGAWQSPYLFNAKELDSETGLYYYGARYLDPTHAMWLSVDPLWEKYAGMSPYGYCAGNPVGYVDFYGCFRLATFTDGELKDLGLTREELTRFETLLQNIGNLVDKTYNSEVLSVISKTTGLSEKEILSDMKYGEGPEIDIINSTSYSTDKGIYINSEVVKELAHASDNVTKSYTSGRSELDYVSFATSMVVLHEYGHYGDKKTNGGCNTGQWTMENGQKIYYTDKNNQGDKALKYGKQGETKTGHRGDDITFLAFGVKVTEGSVVCPVLIDPQIDASKRNRYFQKGFHLKVGIR